MELSLQSKTNLKSVYKLRERFIEEEKLHINDKIDYEKFQELYEKYGEDFTEKEFAKYFLDIDNLKHYGSKYIAETIFILYTARDYCDENLEGKIYPVVAKKFEKTINNIKTNIKNATDIMYYECEEEVLRKYLGHCYFSKPKPKEVMLNVLKRIS